MPQSSLVAWLKTTSSPAKDLSKCPTRDAKETPPAVHALSPTPPPPPSSDDDKPPPSAPSQEVAASLLRPLPSFPHSPPLPPNVHFRACTRQDIPQLKRLTSLLLPIPYPESFYREIIENPKTNDLTLLAFWYDNDDDEDDDHHHHPQERGTRGRLVGALRCRILAHAPVQKAANTHSNAREDDKPMLYLSTLVLLSPYRGHGIASQMLRLLTQRAVQHHDVGSAGAHVWEANDEALEWYRKRGFHPVAMEKEYYRRLQPTGAVVLQRNVGVMDLV